MIYPDTMGSSVTACSTGQLVRAQRARCRLTQLELAHAAHVTPGTVFRVEADKVSPSIATLQSLAEALGVLITDLVPPRGA